MSKRILGVVLVMGALVASNAYASRARDLVLGTGDGGVILGGNGSNGTFYTDDAYNMFYNPAYVNDYKNWAIIEKSNFSAGVGSTALPAGATGSAIGNGGATAQGGFATSIGGINTVLFFNRQDDLEDTIYVNGAAMRPIELLIGSDMNGIKWGLGVSYAAASASDARNTAQTTSVNDIVARVGFSYMDFEPFFNWRISGTDNNVLTVNGGAGQPSNKGIMGGLRYHWGEWTPFAVYKYTQYNSTTDFRAYGIGLGRTMKPTEAVKLAYSVAFMRESVGYMAYNLSNTVNSGNTVSTPFNGTTSAGDRTVVPINVSVEADAAAWLTLRAGLGYNFLDRVNSSTFADDTNARIGATAHAGKVDFDFAVGQGSGGAGTTNESANDTNAQSFDIAHNFFTAGSVQYHW